MSQKLDRLKAALPRLTDEKLDELIRAHNADPYVAMEHERGQALQGEKNKRLSRKANEKIDAILEEVS